MYFATSILTSKIPSLPVAGLIRKKPSKRRQKRHNYTQYDADVDYIFEPADADGFSYLTSQGGNIRRGDYIVLGNNVNPVQYQVEAIDYYSNPSDMWLASLKPIGNEA